MPKPATAHAIVSSGEAGASGRAGEEAGKRGRRAAHRRTARIAHRAAGRCARARPAFAPCRAALHAGALGRACRPCQSHRLSLLQTCHSAAAAVEIIARIVFRKGRRHVGRERRRHWWPARCRSALKFWLRRAGRRALAGCADGDGCGGDPGAAPLAAGQSCGTIRAGARPARRAGARRPRSRRRAQGKKLPPADKADVDRYNYAAQPVSGCALPRLRRRRALLGALRRARNWLE